MILSAKRMKESFVEKQIVERDLLERLLEKALRTDKQMDKTIRLFGDHYTYRDLQRSARHMAAELEQEHLYTLLDYPESRRRCQAIRERVLADPQYAQLRKSSPDNGWE